MNCENIWDIEKSECTEYLFEIQKFLFIEYSRILGDDIMYAEPCRIYNDPQTECPMIIINTTPILIRIAQTSLSYWAQTIFQLSHELCHNRLTIDFNKWIGEDDNQLVRFFGNMQPVK